MSQPEERTKFLYPPQRVLSARTASAMLSGVPWTNWPVGSMLPMHSASAGAAASTRSMSEALPKWQASAPREKTPPSMCSTALPQL